MFECAFRNQKKETTPNGVVFLFLGLPCKPCSDLRVPGGELVAAVDKIEEKRKPEDFIGHRNRA